jgi:tetratricopeptide (TPR) repeat protein
MRPLLAKGIFPEKAAEFIEEKGLPPNIYHPYEWGGYIIWKLYPRYKAFIDSRGIGSVKEYKRVLNAEPGWEEILEKHGVNTVLYWPLLPYRADVPPVLFELQRHSGWSPAYWDSRSVIFVRSKLTKDPISRNAVWELMKSLLFIRIKQYPADPDNYNTLGEIYAERGRRALAAEAFRKALSLDPENIRAVRNLRSLQQ